MKETVVVLGNGFDIALGMKTSYKDFFNSKFWPFDKNSKIKSFKLDGFLNEQMENRERENWYDLENLLAEYPLRKGFEESFKSDDEKHFKSLRKALRDFVDYEQHNVKELKRGAFNPVAIFLKTLFETRNPIIYSFNYTDLKEFSKVFEIRDFSYIPVHGTIHDKNIVLGIDDSYEIPSAYSFLKKVSEPTYKSCNLFYDLCVAQEVIFFGHSLGKNDFHFFKHFFKTRSNENNINYSKRCKITIFTKDSKSRMDILSNLRAMNGGRNNELFALNDLSFIRTDDKDDKDNITIMEINDWKNQMYATKDD